MYDKSKKTWSQRLKITKTTESSNTTTATPTSTFTESSATVTGLQQSEHIATAITRQTITKTKTKITQDSAYNANLFGRHQVHVQQYQTVAATMHLPTLQLSDYHIGNGGGGGGVNGGYEYIPSSLSRSMKYAEPWIYGTVRGIPARPSYHHFMPQASSSPGNYMQPMAVVICSCPEYLNGTKRDVKKASVCKKCKGSRLPLTPIGGTMRLATGGMLATTKMRSSGAATVRVVSTTKKARPTILDPQKDPYDLMRRTRLLSPEPGSSNGGGGGRDAAGSTRDKDKLRGRGKSASPVRGRSRKCGQLPGSYQKQNVSCGGIREESDCWLVEDTDTLLNASGAISGEVNATRRSILRCNVNPYDLISHNQSSSSGTTTPTTPTRSKISTPTTGSGANSASQNEFMPPNDDFNVADAALTEEAPPFASNLVVGGSRMTAASNNQVAQTLRASKSKAENKTTVLRRESRTAGAPNTCVNLSEEDGSSSYDEEIRGKRNYHNVQAIAGQRISLGGKSTTKSLIKQSEDGHSYENLIVSEMSKMSTSKQQSKRRIDEKQVKSHDTPTTPASAHPSRPSRLRKSESSESAESEAEHNRSKSEASKSSAIALDGDRVLLLTVTPNQNIKSILKRPTSSTSESGAESPIAKDQQPVLTASTSSIGAKASTPSNQRRTAAVTPSPTTKSQFYIPLPQTRKKVQFREEERIVHALECDMMSNDEVATEFAGMQELSTDKEDGKELDDVSQQTLKATSNYEYYNRKREQQRLQRLENVSEIERTHPNGQAAQLSLTLPTQDALLAELQQYSDFVTQVIAQASNSYINSSNKSAENAVRDYDGYNFDETAIGMRAAASGSATNSMHYEDLSPITGGEGSDGPTTASSCTNNNKNSTSGSQQQSSDADERTVSFGGTKMLLTQQNAGRSAHSSPAIKATTIAATSSTSLPPTTKATNAQSLAAATVEAAAAVSHVIRSDKNDDYDDDANADDDDGDDGQLDAINKGSNNSDSSDEDVYEDANDVANIADDKHYTVLGSSTVALTTAAASTGADDVLKAELGAEGTQNSATTKIAAREDADYAEVEDGEHSNSKKSANEVEQPQATQLRNPVRRSQSERHPRATTLPIMRTDNASCKNNNNITNNDYQLEDHTTNGDLRFAADICAGSSNASRARKYSNNTYKSNKTESHREEAILSFKDTMALRGKLHRNDSRDLFARPREPPPPPPTPTSSMASSCEADAAVTAAAQTTSTATTNDRAGNNKAATTAATKGGMPAVALMALETSTIAGEATQNCQANTSTLSLGPATSQQPSANKANNAAGAEKNSRVSKVSTNGLEVQQQRQEQEACAKTQTQLAFESRTDSAECGTQQMLKQNIRETKAQQQQQRQKQCVPNAWETKVRAITTPRGSSTSITAKTTPHQRTVVRVAPFNKTKTTSEVHRLKISHTDNDDAYSAQPHLRVGQSHQSPTSPHYSFQYNGTNGSTFDGEAADLTMSTAQKKTSILINGDDCYSTMNLSCDDTNTPLYQSSVVVADYSAKTITGDTTNDFALGSNYSGLRVTTSSNTVTINVSSARSVAEELIYQHNKINTMLSQQAENGSGNIATAGRAIIPIKGSTEVNLQRSASSTSSTSTSSMTSLSSSGSGGGSSGSMPKRGRTLIRLDYEPENSTNPKQQQQQTELCSNIEICVKTPEDDVSNTDVAEPLSHEEELLKILRNPVEAVKRNLVPHICGRNETSSARDNVRNRKMKNVGKQVVGVKDTKATTNKASMVDDNPVEINTPKAMTSTTTPNKTSFITKLLEDPMLSQVADGLETETVAELIENSLRRLQESRSTVDMTGTKDNDDMNRLINISLQKIKEERQHSGVSATSAANVPSNVNNTHLTIPTKDEDGMSNRGSISSANSFASANNYEMFDFDANESDCYQSCSSEITTPGDDDISSANTRSKFYQMLVDATLAEIEMSTNLEEDIGSHHYESIRNNADPIYEEINDVPPPLPLSAPPISDTDLEKKAARSIFEGASKYDILSYLVDAKERGVVREETFDYPLSCSNPIIIEEEAGDTLSELGKRQTMRDLSSRASVLSDSSEDAQSMMSSLSPPTNNFICGNGSHASLLQRNKGASSDIERNDSGVGSETSKSSRSKYQNPLPTVSAQLSKDCPIHLCEDCDGPVETQVSDSGIMFAPLVCRKCGKKRMERKEIITEIVETEEKYGRDLQIILEEFCHPMLVAGLLTQEQLSAIFLNTEELLENNQTLAERMRDALDIALEQGDDDLLTVNIGKIFLDFTQMLHAFESYCVRQAGASLLLANLEKEKELLRIFLKVSQMENAVLRRMNLNSFLMVPVQRVTKYPLLLARLYKVTPAHLEGRDQLKQAQEKIELHLNHINQEAKDVPTKLWRRISSSSPNRRASSEIDMINIKLRKMAIDILEWNHDEVRFAMEGKLLYTQPTDSNWKKARTIKLTPVNALLVTNGKPSANYKAEKVMSDKLNFPKHTGIREASLLVVKEKCGRYTLIREPLYLDRCVVCSEADLDDYFEVQEISSKDTFIFKAEDGVRTKQWYTQLQFHAQGMGAWRKRRNALANIMINGMLARN
ncbi:serine-rich adhesin for platelets isoform X2 [Zeugodacus cucurbitae]|uniref:Myosin-M heavy chain n=1 Tax=Zeugodacus cucurbitae TaxID=28588 RepID=A0A0A1XBQ7_ZEUCU|nr:serine-rich adhesin for platelets isoform X2 [Zeugodacus cucurbitae]